MTADHYFQQRFEVLASGYDDPYQRTAAIGLKFQFPTQFPCSFADARKPDADPRASHAVKVIKHFRGIPRPLSFTTRTTCSASALIMT